ncbi:MAG: hypothetical protein LBJ16_02215 [Holosporaceae bacterium]|nr:hypothetical protein [Holosporaceae bacterium]
MVHEDPSTEATQKLPKERMFRKTSIKCVPIHFYSLCLQTVQELYKIEVIQIF